MAAVVLWMWQIRAHKASIPCLLPCLSPESLSSLRSFQPSSSAYKSLDTASPFQSQFPLSGRFFFPFFFFFLFNFTILYWFCHISKWICHRYTCVPHPEPSSLPIPSLWVVPVHQPQASSIVRRTWTGDSFHIWCYTYFNAILPNHPTLSLSHRVQKTVLYTTPFFTWLNPSGHQWLPQKCLSWQSFPHRGFSIRMPYHCLWASLVV